MITDGEDFHIEGNQLFISRKPLDKYKNLQGFLLSCIIGIFESDFKTRVSFKQQIIREIFSNIIITIQVVSLFWYPDMSIRHWSSYSTIWNCFRFFNYDYLFAKQGLYTFYFILSSTINASSIFIVFLHCGCKYFNCNLPGILLMIAKALLYLFSSISLIPYLTTLIIVIKYSAFDYRYVQEYDDHDADNYNFGILGTISSFLILVVFVPIVFLIEMMKADLRHSVAHKNIKARSNSSWDLLCILFFIAQCFLFAFVDKSHYEYRIMIGMVMAVYLLVLEFRFLHYFNPVENSIQACKMGNILVCLVVFLFGYLTDNPTTLTLLCIFLLPLSCLFITIYVHRKYSVLKFNRINPKSQFTLEHSIRHLLVDEQYDAKSEVIEMLSEQFNSKLKKNSLYVIWEVNFCIYIAKDERLGRVKLTKYSLLKQNIEACIQKFRILEKFEKNVSGLSEIKNLDRILCLDEAKKFDVEICLILLDLWAEIARKDPEINKLKHFIKKVCSISKKIKSLYESLSQEIRNSEILDLYGLFLINILGEVEEGNAILKRKLNIKNSGSLNDFKKFESYDQSFGIILVSTETSSFGSIAYMNAKAAAILNVSPIEMINRDFNQFIPKPYSLHHNDHMFNYYRLCTCTELEISHSSFLQKLDGYIFECKVVIKLTAFKNNAYYRSVFLK
ncbi:unnamed protein product [Blepharisma stoltei]|uniref:TmcB/TmcC TPR repeats domain-containing protein n=1 Tax=Blepharisma stoltei TaxID=1481888 RepID=A0AAU9KBB1_9CILI|nr:unnamed protein product [Blepharisma stoltei]